MPTWCVLCVLGLLVDYGTPEDLHKERVEHAPHVPINDQHYDADGKHNVVFDHQAVLGSKNAEHSSLPPDMAKKKLSGLVDKMDASQDGFVSHQELMDWVLRSFRMLNDEEAHSQMAIHDMDKDGNLTWSEYLEMVYGFQEEDIRDFHLDKNQQVRALGEVINQDHEKFLSADVNENGMLDMAEYTAFMHPYDFAHMHSVEIRRVLRTYDKNKDGVMDLKEFMQEEDFPAEQNSEQDIVDTENFKAYDKNKNGLLEPDEIRVWALPDHQEAADYEADHLISQTDLNGDGYLSKREILAKYNLWVGSAASDYGHNFHDAGEL